MAIIKAEQATLSTFFKDAENRIEIPRYQRSYSWAREQVDDLLADIERFHARRKGGPAKYFMGAIVSVPQGHSIRILDGQQRLATLTILLAALRDALAPLDGDKAKKLDWRFLHDDDDDETPFKLQLGAYDQDFFQRYVLSSPPETLPKNVERASHKLIKDAALRCRDWLATRVEQQSDKRRAAFLTDFQKTVVTHLEFVDVQVDSEEEATDVFEVLNERGIGLSVLDLVRNFVLGKAKGVRKQEQVAQYWGDVFSVSESQAKVQQFLRHYWISRHGDVKSRGLYREIKARLGEQFSEGTTTPVDFSNDLSLAADTYQRLIAPDGSLDDRLTRQLHLIRQYDATSLYPALLASIEKHGEDGAADLAEALLCDFVRWSVIGRRESTVLEQRVFGVAKDIWDGADVAAASEALRVGSLSDDEFTEAFKGASVAKSAWRKGVLLQLEAFLREQEDDGEAEVMLDSAALNVEHIYPQSPAAGVWEKLDDHADLVDRIGNLTLVNRRVNSRMQNRDFATKKRPEFASSSLCLNEWVGQQEAWGETEINQRQNDLAGHAAEIWGFRPAPGM